MAGEILKLLAEYGKTLAPINIDFILGKPTDKSQLYTALDKIDYIKLFQNINPNIALKATLLETYFLPMEKITYIPEFINKLQLEADRLIRHLTTITLNYTVEFIEIVKDISAITESIVRNLEAIINMIFYFTLLFVFQLLYHLVVDVLWTILNLVYMSVWVVYADLFMPVLNSTPNGTMIKAVLIPWQTSILVLYLVYILLMIVQYVVNYVLSILLLLDLSLAILTRRAVDIVILFDRALEQVTGAAGMIPLILSVIDSRAKGTAVLKAQLVSPLPI